MASSCFLGGFRSSLSVVMGFPPFEKCGILENCRGNLRHFAAFCGVQTPFSAKSRPAPGAAQQPWVAVFLLYTQFLVFLNLFLKKFEKYFFT